MIRDYFVSLLLIKVRSGVGDGWIDLFVVVTIITEKLFSLQSSSYFVSQIFGKL